MPWIVVLFGILVGPLGAVSVLLVMVQPVAYGTFCTLCLGIAVISVLMIGPAMDEMLASLQYMRRVRAHGRPFWTYFWGRGEQEFLSEPPPRLEPLARTPVRGWIGSSAQWVAAAAGIYLIVAPSLWGYESTRAADVDRIIGPLVAAFAMIAAWECTRNTRWLNLLLAIVLVLLAVLPWPVETPRVAMISDLVAGGLIILLTCLPYALVMQYGGGWRWLWPWRPASAPGEVPA